MTEYLLNLQRTAGNAAVSEVITQYRPGRVSVRSGGVHRPGTIGGSNTGSTPVNVQRREGSVWEQKEGTKRTEKQGTNVDDHVVWKDGLYWTPIEDAGRNGMVVGYIHRNSGLTEVVNTDGELMAAYERPLEKPYIPVVDEIAWVLKQAGYVLVGTVDTVLEDNWRALGLPPKDHPLASFFGIPDDAVAYRIGRGAGHALVLLQAAAEIVGGATLVAGGSGEFLVGAATTPAGVGLVIMPVGVATVAAGTTVLVHGGALAGAVFMSATGSGGGGGGGKPRKKWEMLEKNIEETRIHSRSHYRYYKNKVDKLWWSKDATAHGGSQWKVYRETGTTLEWVADADEFGDFIVGKHKGPTGLSIPLDELIPVGGG